ncbi:MAG: AraC family transcriptional regulator [Pseudomonadota bacterium]
MQFEAAELPDDLASLIEAVFHYKGFFPEHSIERVVPTGHVFVLFELDGMERSTYDDDGQVTGTFSDAWISGLQRTPLSISAHPDSEMFVIQFKGAGALPFLHTGLSEFSETVRPGAAVLGGELIGLRQQLHQQPSSAAKFEVALGWLRARFRKELLPPDALLAVVRDLENSPGAQFASIVSNYPHTPKHLIDQFQKYLGVTPKVYQRILRFNEIFQYLQQHKEVGWAAVAAHCGYADQSHFIREFKHFCGFNPEEFLREGHDVDEPNFFPLN